MGEMNSNSRKFMVGETNQCYEAFTQLSSVNVKRVVSYFIHYMTIGYLTIIFTLISFS